MTPTPPYNDKQVLLRVYELIKNCLRVCVVNTAADPVPVEIVVGATSSLVKHFPFSGDFTGGTTVTAISETVPAGKTWNLKQSITTCGQPLKIEIKVGGSVIGSGRLGPSVLNRDYEWVDGYEVAAGVLVEIDLTLLHGKPTNTSAESYLMIRET